jgi:hypothetical protein
VVATTDNAYSSRWNSNWDQSSLKTGPEPMVSRLLWAPSDRDGFMGEHHLGVAGMDMTRPV